MHIKTKTTGTGYYKNKYFLFIVGIILFMTLPIYVNGQGLFEQSIQENKQNIPEISGYIRGLDWIGEADGSPSWEQKSMYGEGSLKIKTHDGYFGVAKMEIRFREGLPSSAEAREIELREAYVNLYLGRFGFRVGQQINVWGRADSYNPTDNITPVNPLFHSPESDDIRLGNFLIKGNFMFSPSLSLEGDWIPVYKPSVIPLQVVSMGDQVNFMGLNNPEDKIKNSGYAFRINADHPAVSYSFSWFDGYEPYPGLQYGGFSFGADSLPKVDISTKPFREQVLGFDFSTSLGSFGLRGEFAYRRTKDHEKDSHVALPDIRYVVGIDRTAGDFTVIAQYIGHYVIDFSEPKTPGEYYDSPSDMILYYNRLMFRQTDRISHMVSLHPSLSVMHDDLTLEMYGEYNFTTREYLLVPEIKWSISDAIRLIAGGNIFHGETYSLYDMIRPLMNGAFLECRVTF